MAGKRKRPPGDQPGRAPEETNCPSIEHPDRGVQSDPDVRVLSAGDTPILDPAAYVGTVGRLVEAVAGETEACGQAVAAAFLAGASARFGREPYVDRGPGQPCSNFWVICGQSSQTKKDTAAGLALEVLRQSDEDFYTGDRTVWGLATGEGLIERLADERWEEVEGGDGEPKLKKRLSTPEEKRLFAVVPEAVQIFGAGKREGNTLSQHIRRAFDGSPLDNATRSRNRVRASNYHATFVALVTNEELISSLTELDSDNGFLQRLLLVPAYQPLAMSRASRYDVASVVTDLRLAFEEVDTHTRQAGGRWTVGITRPANGLLRDRYFSSLDAPAAGYVGKVAARERVHSLRLSLLYALLEGRAQIEVRDVEAALAWADLQLATAGWIWGEGAGDRDRNRLYQAVERKREGALTLTEAARLFGNRLAPRDRAIKAEVEAGSLALWSTPVQRRGGRPGSTTRWIGLPHRRPPNATPVEICELSNSGPKPASRGRRSGSQDFADANSGPQSSHPANSGPPASGQETDDSRQNSRFRRFRDEQQKGDTR